MKTFKNSHDFAMNAGKSDFIEIAKRFTKKSLAKRPKRTARLAENIGFSLEKGYIIKEGVIYGIGICLTNKNCELIPIG